jgi:hypothetical protein
MKVTESASDSADPLANGFRGHCGDWSCGDDIGAGAGIEGHGNQKSRPDSTHLSGSERVRESRATGIKTLPEVFPEVFCCSVCGNPERWNQGKSTSPAGEVGCIA